MATILDKVVKEEIKLKLIIDTRMDGQGQDERWSWNDHENFFMS